jgi:thiamine transport system substrate-binding protein
MLSVEFQTDIPGQMFVYPVHPGVSLPEEFTNFAQLPAQPATIPPAEIALHREGWIKAWTDAVLR